MLDSSAELKGKVAIVTGGSKGLGLAMARAFAEAGADIIISSRKLDACDTAAREIHEATGRRCVPIACHVGDWEQCKALIERVVAEFGRIDILVNNAPTCAEVALSVAATSITS